MKLRCLVFLLGFGFNAAWADFSNASIQLHPYYPFDGPFIIEITGDWPTDCHPGEQHPVIKDYDGKSVLIEFDMVVIHITCNQKPTPYRVLVDMSDVVGSVAGQFSTLDITVRFGDAELKESVMLDCGPVTPCQMPPVEDVMPETGVFNNSGLEDQGLLLARQNQWLAAYPLVYDDMGGSEWLFAGGEIIQDVFFAPLHELSGGQCLGCPPPDEAPQLNAVGKLTLLMDSPGIIQVKVNDSPFTEYRSLVFGYDRFELDPDGRQTLIDLAGRWGLSENRGTDPPLGDLSKFFPGAFNIEFDVEGAAGQQIPLAGQVQYRVTTVTGETLGQLLCGEQPDSGAAMVACAYSEPGDAEEPLFWFYQEGPSSLAIEYARPVIAVGIAPGGEAIRLD